MNRKYSVIATVGITVMLLFPILVHPQLQKVQTAKPMGQPTSQKVQRAVIARPVVQYASKRRLKLEPGGGSERVVLRGNHLQNISGYRLLLGKRLVKDIEVTLGPAAAQSRQVTIQAKTTAKPQGNYKLQLLAGSDVVEVPFSLEIVAPQMAMTPAAPSGSPTGRPRPANAPLPGENRPELQESPAATARPVHGTTAVGTLQPVDANGQIQNQIYDFQITDVYYQEKSGHKAVWVDFTSGTVGGNIYAGELSCTFRIGGGNPPSSQTVTIPNASTQYFSIPLNWPALSDYTCGVQVGVTINPGNAVPELNTDNNVWEGHVYEHRGADFQISYVHGLNTNRPEKGIQFLWEQNWACGSNRILSENEVSSDPGYDPYDHFLYAGAEIGVRNCGAAAGEALIEVSYIGYDRERREQYQVTVQPFQTKTINAGTPMKIRKAGNYLKVRVTPSQPHGDECRIDLKFRDLPWDWQ